MTHPLGDLFARDGHLSMLSLDRYDQHELAAGACRELEGHVEGCSTCRARLELVRHPAMVPSPPRAPGAPIRRHDAGLTTVAYLVATSAVALAATALLWTGAPGWPSRQTALQHQVEPSHTAGSYTSVAQEYSDTAGLDLEVEWGDTALASPSAEGWLAVVALDGELDAPPPPEIVAVIAAPHSVGEETQLGIGRRWAAHRVVVVFCPASFDLAAGEPFVPAAGCVVRERGVAR